MKRSGDLSHIRGIDLPSSLNKVYWINVQYGCFCIESRGGIVVEAADIAKWTKGKNIDFVLDYFKKKKAEIKEITNDQIRN